MGQTRERVRQIREKALKKLKSTSMQKLLKEFCARKNILFSSNRKTANWEVSCFFCDPTP